MSIVKRYRRSDTDAKFYHDQHDRLMLASAILNTGADVKPSIHTLILDKGNIKRELNRLVGDEKGKYRNDNEQFTAEIPYLQEQIDEIDLSFVKLNIDRTIKGMPTLDAMPLALKQQLQYFEAKMDVALTERNFLEERLSKFTVAEESAKEDQTLQYGLRQQVTLKDGVISEIDGQPVVYLEIGPVISEGRYRGMAVKDYRVLATKWLAERRANELRKFQNLCAELREKGLPVPVQRKVTSIKAVDKDSLPAYPPEYENHLEKVEK